MPPTQSGGIGETMNESRQKSGTRRASRRIVRGAMTVGMTSVVLMAFAVSAATAASAAPAAVNPPPPTGTITTLPSGVQSKSRLPGHGAGSMPRPAPPPDSSAAKTSASAGPWSGTTPTTRATKSPTRASPSRSAVTTTSAGNSQGQPGPVSPALPCGTYGTRHHGTVDGHPQLRHRGLIAHGENGLGHLRGDLRPEVDPQEAAQRHEKNRKNSFRAASGGNVWPPTACIEPVGPARRHRAITTTSTSAQAGAPITDTATLAGTSQDFTPAKHR